MTRSTCPQPNVSRTGSSANTSGTARATVQPLDQPRRAATGATSHHVTRTTRTAETVLSSTVAVVSVPRASGSSTSAANGGEGEALILPRPAKADNRRAAPPPPPPPPGTGRAEGGWPA